MFDTAHYLDLKDMNEKSEVIEQTYPFFLLKLSIVCLELQLRVVSVIQTTNDINMQVLRDGVCFVCDTYSFSFFVAYIGFSLSLLHC